MNKYSIIALIFLILINLVYSSIIYTLDIDRSSKVTGIFSSNDENQTFIPIPKDATNIRIVGGSYESVPDGFVLTSGSSGFTSFSFVSDMLTTKTGSIWTLYAKIPNNSKIRILLPPYSRLDSSNPIAQKISYEDQRIVLEISNSTSVTINYSLDDVPIIIESQSNNYFYFGLIFLLFLSMVIYYFKFWKKPIQKNSKSITELTFGKKQMIETMNENDIKIVDLLMKSNGKSKRNYLERTSGISKSSLSVALNRLERRKIIEIDRTSTVHMVKLSDYFQNL